MTETDLLVVTSVGEVPPGFSNFYTERYPAGAPQLDDRLDARGQAIYGGFDGRILYPADSAADLGLPSEDVEQIGAALDDHRLQSMQLARRRLGMSDVVWLGPEGLDKALTVDQGRPNRVPDSRLQDEHGVVEWFRPVDVGVVGPRQDTELGSKTIAIGVADCLAIPIIDQRTEAFALVHAGRSGTGLRAARIAVEELMRLGSRPADLAAYLGESICANCHLVDERGLEIFLEQFGGKSEINKVTEQYPDALRVVETPQGRRYSIDLYPFNRYLLAQSRIGAVTLAPQCTARLNEQCPSVAGCPVPAEAEQPFYSHRRVGNSMYGWRTADGESLELQARDIGTPRNLTAVTRLAA